MAVKQKRMSELMLKVYQNAKRKGFWDEDTVETFPKKVMLVVTELSEAIEADRKEIYSGKHCVGEEIADATIRIFDLCQHYGINLYEEIVKKIQENGGREYKHGKKY